MRRVAAIIVAAGSGTRFGSQKQLVMLGNKPLVLHSLLTFAAFLKRELRPRAPTTGAGRPSLDDVLQQVQRGQLDVAQAYQLLQQIDA